MGIPILRTKLLAFGLSGFIAGYAGRVLRLRHPVPEQHGYHLRSNNFLRDHLHGRNRRPGVDSRSNLGALYLEGLPAIFGSNQTIQFITSGLGLLAFILYLPGGLAEVLHRTGDLVTLGVRNLKERYRPGPVQPLPPEPSPTPALVGEGVET